LGIAPTVPLGFFKVNSGAAETLRVNIGVIIVNIGVRIDGDDSVLNLLRIR
jgi:hypothetical protein